MESTPFTTLPVPENPSHSSSAPSSNICCSSPGALNLHEFCLGQHLGARAGIVACAALMIWMSRKSRAQQGLWTSRIQLKDKKEKRGCGGFLFLILRAPVVTHHIPVVIAHLIPTI